MGKTAQAPGDKTALGFQCDGVFPRIDRDGEVRFDDERRKVMLAEAARGAGIAADKSAKWLVPVAGAISVGAATVNDEEEEMNPSLGTPQ